MQLDLGAPRMRLMLVLNVVAAVWLAVLPAMAATGTALDVEQGASAQSNGNIRVLDAGSDLAIGETVETDANGLVQIRFDDKTELVVGPNSSLRLEDYLLRQDGSAGNFAIKALAGTFRFVTGNAPKSRYQIATPTGNIGIRGTAFDFTVTKKKTDVLLYHGAAVLCSSSQDCVTLDDSCEVGTYGPNVSEVVGLTRKLRPSTRSALSERFRYAANQSPLRRDFRVDVARNCFSKSPAEIEQPRAKPIIAADPCTEAASCSPLPPPPPPPTDSGGCSATTDHCGDDDDHSGPEPDDDGNDGGGSDHNDNGHHYGNDKGDSHENKGKGGGQGSGNGGNRR